MFILAIIAALLLGFVFKGKIRNLEHVEIKGLYYAFAGFFIEFSIIILITKGIIERGNTTFILDLIMYVLLFIFIYVNKSNWYIILMGIGFLLNAIPIFANGGAMPVGMEAIKIAGLPTDISKEGLYVLLDKSTRFWFLGDILPLNFITHLAISAGDIVTAIGLMLFIITGMKNSKPSKENSIKI